MAPSRPHLSYSAIFTARRRDILCWDAAYEIIRIYSRFQCKKNYLIIPNSYLETQSWRRTGTTPSSESAISHSPQCKMPYREPIDLSVGCGVQPRNNGRSDYILDNGNNVPSHFPSFSPKLWRKMAIPSLQTTYLALTSPSAAILNIRIAVHYISLINPLKNDASGRQLLQTSTPFSGEVSSGIVGKIRTLLGQPVAQMLLHEE